MSIEKLSTNASLKDVMDKFEEISLRDFSSIDIITANELPSKGKDGQLCIITDVEPSKIILDYVAPNLLESEIFIKYHTNSEYSSLITNNNKLKILFSIREISQKINGEDVGVFGYIWMDDKWVRTVPLTLYLFENGVGDNTAITGGYNKYIKNKPTTDSGTSATINTSSIALKTDSSNGSVTYATVTSKNSIDVTPYNKLYVDFKCSCSSENNAVEKFGVGLYSSNADNTSFNAKYETKVTVSRTTIAIDISKISGEKYFKALIHANDYASGIPSANIYNVWME